MCDYKKYMKRIINCDRLYDIIFIVIHERYLDHWSRVKIRKPKIIRIDSWPHGQENKEDNIKRNKQMWDLINKNW